MLIISAFECALLREVGGNCEEKDGSRGENASSLPNKSFGRNIFGSAPKPPDEPKEVTSPLIVRIPRSSSGVGGTGIAESGVSVPSPSLDMRSKLSFAIFK